MQCKENRSYRLHHERIFFMDTDAKCPLTKFWLTHNIQENVIVGNVLPAVSKYNSRFPGKLCFDGDFIKTYFCLNFHQAILFWSSQAPISGHNVYRAQCLYTAYFLFVAIQSVRHFETHHKHHFLFRYLSHVRCFHRSIIRGPETLKCVKYPGLQS
jgi:hypothetical protein